MKLISGNSNLPLARAIADYLELPLTDTSVRRFADEEVFVEIHENVRGAGCLHRPADQLPGQRQSDGIADHHRRAAPRLGEAHHRGRPLFRLCPPGPQTRPAHADFGQAGRQSDHHLGRRPRARDRPARRADPGLFRHPDRQSLRRAGDERRHSGALRGQESDGRVARRRRRGARPRARQAARQRAAGDRRQAPRARRRIRSDEHHRRRVRAASAS